MNEKRAAQALNTISLGFAELAEALGAEQPGSVAASQTKAGSPSAATPAGSPIPAELPPSFDELPPDEAAPQEWATQTLPGVTQALPDVATARRPETPQGALAQCPKHHVLYKTGKYGKYCPSISDDPSWRNDKGFCRITPKNAAAWLAETAA